MKKVKDKSVLPAISLNSSDGLTVLYGQPHATQIGLTVVGRGRLGLPCRDRFCREEDRRVYCATR